MNNLYNIIEVANTHGGNLLYVERLIDKFSCYKDNFGIKFQPFMYDTIATADFSFHETYKKLFFSEKEWKNIISKAYETKDVWLDLFDTYGVKILSQNLSKITGIKFQTSVLYNYELFEELLKINLTDKLLILNVAAREIEDIKEIVDKMERLLQPKEIILEFGYQGYPTLLEYSGINKLSTIKENFSNRIVYADHVDGKSEEAILLPLFVAALGIDMLEKHVMLDDMETKFDEFSSLTPERYEMMLNKLNTYLDLFNKPFINDKELEYLNNSIMIPILNKTKKAGDLISLKDDFIYRRSGQKGLNAKRVEELLKEYHILAVDKKAGESLQEEDFRKAKIAVVIACRLKSTRLPRKALLNIGTLSSVELCIKNCFSLKNVDHVILATSNLPEDAELKNHIYSDKTLFFAGDPDDVIKRYLNAVEPLGVDIIARITADCPYPSSEIFDILLKEHFIHAADYSTAAKFAVGSNVEIYNVKALKVVKEYFTSAMYSEYMTWYLINNPDFFKLNYVELPEFLVRDYRLTLDYEEDLVMFNHIQSHFDENGIKFSITALFDYLDAHPEIANINSHLGLKYKTDKKLIETLDRETKMHKNGVS